MVEPPNIERTGRPLVEESAHDHLEELPTSQEMLPVERDRLKPAENVELAETSQNTAFARSNLE